MASASKGYFAIAEESAAGVAEANPDFYYPVQNVDFPYENQYIDAFEIQGSRQAKSSQPGIVEGTATVGGLIYPSGGFGKLLKGLLGSVDSAAQGEAHVHAYGDTEDGGLPYFTLERADSFASEGGLFAERLAGAKVESIAIECPFGDLVTHTTRFQAIKRPMLVSPQARPTESPWPTARAVTFTGAAIKVNGVDNSMFTNMSIEITNNLQRQNALNGTNESFAIEEGGLNCTLSGAANFRNLELRQMLEEGTEFAVEFNLTNNIVADATSGAKEGIKFVWNNVKLASVGLPMQANEIITSDVSFRVDFDRATNSSVQVFMTNKEDGSLY